PNDGMKLGLVEMIEDVVERAAKARESGPATRDPGSADVDVTDEISVARVLSALEDGTYSEAELTKLREQWTAGSSTARPTTPVVGITGTGGAGKSSAVDELLLRFLHAFPTMRIPVLPVDPTRRRSGGAMLGVRIL